MHQRSTEIHWRGWIVIQQFFAVACPLVQLARAKSYKLSGEKIPKASTGQCQIVKTRIALTLGAANILNR